MQDQDDNRRFMTALFISMLLVFFYTQYFMPRPEPNAAQQASAVATAAPSSSAPSSSLEQGSKPQTDTSASSAPQGQSQASAHPSVSDLNKSEKVVVESGKFILVVNTLGAKIESMKLKGYTLQLGESTLLDMVHSNQSAALPLSVRFGNQNDDFVRYSLTQQPGQGPFRVPGDSNLTLRFSGALPDGRQITKTFVFQPESYLFEVDVRLSAPESDGSPLWLEWTRYVSTVDSSARYDQKDFLILDERGKLVRIQGPKVEQGVRDVGKGSWVSIADQYFISTIIPENSLATVAAGREGDVLVERVEGGSLATKFRVFAGPKIYEDLEKTGFSLEKNVDMGMFSFLAYPILLLLRIFYSWLGNYGLAIILLTLVIKLAFLPLTSASFKSMRAMQEIQPEVQALRERIEDPTKLNQELMSLYKRRGVNPLGGCLPVMIQIPVFLGLYNALLNAIELRHAPFAIWITDLSAPERLEIFGIGVPLMILIMGASMLIQQWTTPTTMDPAQKKAFLLMPVMFTAMFVIFPMPSGLVLYWLINNIISIIQQAFLRKESGLTPFKATIIGSVAIFAFGYLLVLI